MAEWLNNPVIVLVALAILGLLGKAIYWVAGVDKDRRALKDDAEKDRTEFKEKSEKDRSEILGLIKEIREDIKNIFLRLPPAPVAGSSPLRLTDFGNQISSSIKAEEWANELAPTLLDDVQGKQPFEVDEFCQDYVQQKLSDLWQGKVAGCAYEFGIDKDGVLAVLRVVLRDELLRLMNKPDEATQP